MLVLILVVVNYLAAAHDQRVVSPAAEGWGAARYLLEPVERHSRVLVPVERRNWAVAAVGECNAKGAK